MVTWVFLRHMGSVEWVTDQGPESHWMVGGGRVGELGVGRVDGERRVRVGVGRREGEGEVMGAVGAGSEVGADIVVMRMVC